MIELILIGFGLSFIGSLPFGMINMAVAHTAINKGLRAGVWMALGAAIIEMLQVFIALKFTWLFAEGGVLSNILQIIATVVFFGAGIYFFFFAKSKKKSFDEQENFNKKNVFLKGMLISSLNLIAIPYWIFYGTLLVANGLLMKENKYVIIFSISAMFGVFVLLIGYAYLGAKLLSRSEQITKWVNRFIGAVLFGFGVYQLYKLLIADC